MAKGLNRNQMGPSQSMVIPALIVGGAILAGSMVVKTSLDKTTTQLADIRSGLNETKVALDAVASAKNTAAAPSRRRGPDPNKRYTLITKGRPVKGPAHAKVEIVEFSDFQ